MKKIKISNKSPLVLVMVPGFGVGDQRENNVISQSIIPFLRSLINDYPSLALAIDHNSSATKAIKNLLGDRTTNDVLSRWLDKYKTSLWLDSFSLPAVIGSLDIEKCRNNLFSVDNSNLESFNMQLNEIHKKIIKSLKAESEEIYVWIWSGLDQVALYADKSEEITDILGNFDLALKKIYKNLQNRNGTLVFTSPYGRVESMYGPDEEIVDKSINSNPVPAVLANKELRGIDLGWGSISQGDFTLLTIKEKSRKFLASIEKYFI
jgi:bisphosphoglycerate-independent phosphoglycerate mutase (AlkP superfamily)